MASVYGRCFMVLAGPYLFARIGLTPETAHWYALPLVLDEVVEPGDAEYELTVNPGTGWVERVRRLGTDPRELIHEPPVILTGEAARANAEEERRLLREYLRGEATTEEQQAFKRFARAQRPEWRADGWMFAGVGWTGVIAGVVIAVGWSAFVLFLFIRFPHAFRYPVDYEAPDISMIVATAIGLGFVLVGHYYLRIWWRIRTFRHLEPVSTEGEVVAWMPYRDFYTPTDPQSITEQETLIELRRADGTSRIFRIPARYEHRVRERGEVVRIYYRPTTERVVTVHRLGQAPSAASASE